MYRRFQMGALLTLAALALVTNTANAQKVQAKGRTTSNSGIGGLRLPGTGLPEYPRASIRVRNGVLYVEATQEDDDIGIVDDGESTLGILILNERHNVDIGEYVDSRDINLIVVYGLAGDDELFTSTVIPVIFFGGLGDDEWRVE